MQNSSFTAHVQLMAGLNQRASVCAQANGKQNLWGTETAEDVRLDEGKLAAAVARQRAVDAASAEPDERKRKYNSLAGGEELSAEDMEAYRMTRVRADDPMAKYLAGRGDE